MRPMDLVSTAVRVEYKSVRTYLDCLGIILLFPRVGIGPCPINHIPATGMTAYRRQSADRPQEQ